MIYGFCVYNSKGFLVSPVANDAGTGLHEDIAEAAITSSSNEQK